MKLHVVKSRPIQRVFEADEMILMEVRRSWSCEDVLNQKGVFSRKSRGSRQKFKRAFSQAVANATLDVIG